MRVKPVTKKVGATIYLNKKEIKYLMDFIQIGHAYKNKGFKRSTTKEDVFYSEVMNELGKYV